MSFQTNKLDFVFVALALFRDIDQEAFGAIFDLISTLKSLSVLQSFL